MLFGFRVSCFVSFQMMINVETFRANFACEIPFAAVPLFVGLHVGQIHKCLFAHATLVWFLARMNSPVFCQITCLVETLRTELALKWLIVNV